jgi:hypothetical protein
VLSKNTYIPTEAELTVEEVGFYGDKDSDQLKTSRFGKVANDGISLRL